MSSLAHQQPLSKAKAKGKKKSSVSKLASYSQFLPGVVVRKCQNQCIKVLKVSRKHGTKFFLYKNGYKEYKTSPGEPRASKVPAAARFLSSPVCLPSCTAERRGPRGGEAGLTAMDYGKESLSVHSKPAVNRPRDSFVSRFSWLSCHLPTQTPSTSWQ